MRASWVGSVVIAVGILFGGAALAQGTSMNDQLRAANLAPTGVLRVAFLGTNPIQGRVDPESGEVTGPVADIVAELASRLGVSYEFQPVDGAGVVIDAVNSGAADLGFLAYDETRDQEIDYAGPYATMTSSYLVAGNSPLRTSAEVDSAGNVIGTVGTRSQQIFLSNNIQNAEIRIWDAQPPDEEIERMLLSGEITAVGQNRQRSVEHAAEMPSLRVLDDAFMAVPQSFVTRTGETAKADALNRFMDELRDSGFVLASLQRADLLDGASVAPPGIP